MFDSFRKRSVKSWLLNQQLMLMCEPFLQDLWDIKQAAYVFGGHRGPFGQLALNIARGGLKAVITLLLGENIVYTYFEVYFL